MQRRSAREFNEPKGAQAESETDVIIVTGCERSGTTAYGKLTAKLHGVGYTHEKYSDSGVVKHSLNMNQNIKHLELLGYMYPDAKWLYILRDGREVARSMMQKIWKRKPHTMSLDDALEQWSYVNRVCMPFAEDKGRVLKCEKFHRKQQWQDYFTDEQIDYIHDKIGDQLAEYGYISG